MPLLKFDSFFEFANRYPTGRSVYQSVPSSVHESLSVGRAFHECVHVSMSASMGACVKHFLDQRQRSEKEISDDNEGRN